MTNIYTYCDLDVREMNREELLEVIEHLAEENKRLSEESKKYKSAYFDAMRRSFEFALKKEN